MTPVELVKSCLEGYNYTEFDVDRQPTPIRGIGLVTHTIELYQHIYYDVSIGEIGVQVRAFGSSPWRVALILYADPEFKTKLHKAIEYVKP